MNDLTVRVRRTVRRAPETELDAPVGQLAELVDVLLEGLVGEEVIPLASLEDDPDVPVAVLEAAAVPAAPGVVVQVRVELQPLLVPQSRVPGHGADLVLQELVRGDPLVVVPPA